MNLVFLLLMFIRQPVLPQDTAKHIDTSFTLPIPIIVMFADGRKLETRNLIMDNNDIDSLIIPAKDRGREMYGTKAKNGVMVIKAKRYIHLISYYNLLKKYKIPHQYITLPVIVDNLVVENPEDMLAELKAVTGVTVVNQKLKNQMKISITTIYTPQKSNRNSQGETVVLK